MLKTGRMTVDEYIEEYSKLPDARRYELIEGEVTMSPEASPFHGELQILLGTLLRLYAARHPGVRVLGPTNVELSEDSCPGPDLTVIAPGDKTRILAKKISGSPTVLIEFVSPGKPNYDLVKKRALYIKSQVPEVWFFDTSKRNAIFLLRERSSYSEQRIEKGVFESRLLPGFCLDVGALFDLDLESLREAAKL